VVAGGGVGRGGARLYKQTVVLLQQQRMQILVGIGAESPS